MNLSTDSHPLRSTDEAADAFLQVQDVAVD